MIAPVVFTILHDKGPDIIAETSVCVFVLQEWGAAVQCCDDALQVKAAEASAGRAWLRRAKANLGRHEYEVRDTGAQGACSHSWPHATAVLFEDIKSA